MPNITPMQRVEAEIRNRGNNLAWLAAELGVRSQDINNWKMRGIPRNQQIRVANALGWSLDCLLTGHEPARVSESPAMYTTNRDTADLHAAITALRSSHKTNPKQAARVARAVLLLLAEG